MKSVVSALIAGALFGVGLVVSGMTLPSKVIGFLDFAGAWDPSLAFVMIGAILVNVVALAVARRRGTPLLDTRFHLPTRRDLDARLLGGAAIFGIGWGLGGVCPGPGLVGASGGVSTFILFVGAMIGGMLLQHLWEALPRRAADAATTPS